MSSYPLSDTEIDHIWKALNKPRSKDEDSCFSLGSAAIQSDASSVSSESKSSSSSSSCSSSCVPSCEDYDDDDNNNENMNNEEEEEEEDSGSIHDSVSTFITDEEFSSCVKRTIAHMDINFTNSARAAFLRTWMESDDYWLENLRTSHLIFLEKLLKLDRNSPF